MYKIAIIGYGKMGHEVESLLQTYNMQVGVIIDNESDWELKWNQFILCDAAIEFSTPDTALSNLKKCISQNIPLVTGTTGWYDSIDEILKECKEKDSSLIYGSNFSIGANIFFTISTELAKLMNQQQQYDCTIHETHHIAKKDAPSGTAISIANKIIHELEGKKSWILGTPQNDSQLSITSSRIGNVVGEHHVTFSSFEDSLSIVHNANNRIGLATGAVKAALWLIKNPGTYNFSDIFFKI
jgi:4-hydroxy-tetrahydrodipicolinate reductase